MAFGIPPLLNKIANAVNIGSLLLADVGAVLGITSGAQWGLFMDGEQVLLADSVVSFEFKNEWRIADYPLEEGAFQSYNKVAVPFDIKLKMTKGGTEQERQEFIDTLVRLAATLDLYDVVTPEKTYTNTNISHYDYRRQAHNGAGMIIADVWLTEIRVTATAAFTSESSDPIDATGDIPITDAISFSALDSINDGTLQAQVSSALQAQTSSALSSIVPKVLWT